MTIDVEKAKKDLQAYSEQNGSTAEQGIEQEDGSIIVLRSTQGQPTEQFQLSPEEREDLGWPHFAADQA